jgi:hypothetical protein
VFTQVPQIENLSAPKQFSFDAIFKPFSCCCRRLCKRCSARFAIAILSRQINLLQFCRRDENQGPDLLAWENAVLLREERNCECTNPHSHTLLEKKNTHTHAWRGGKKFVAVLCVLFVYSPQFYMYVPTHTLLERVLGLYMYERAIKATQTTGHARPARFTPFTHWVMAELQLY